MIKQPAGVVDPTTSDDSTYQPYQQMIISRVVRNSEYSKLIDSKNRGGLCNPTEFLIRLVTISERVIRMLSSDTHQVISIERLNIEVLRELGGPASTEFHTHAIQTQSGTHKKKLALKSFQLVIKRTHSVKIASLYL